MAQATSSGSPSRCMATRLTMRSYIGESFAFGPMMPGAITLQVTLERAPSRATDLAKPTSPIFVVAYAVWRSEEHTSELQSRLHLVCRLLLEKKKKHTHFNTI